MCTGERARSKSQLKGCTYTHWYVTTSYKWRDLGSNLNDGHLRYGRRDWFSVLTQ
jgi:hypothetical protein